LYKQSVSEYIQQGKFLCTSCLF